MGGQWREPQGPPINNFLEVIPKTLLKGMTSFKKITPSHLNSLSSKLYLHGSTGSWLSSITKWCWRCSTHSTSIGNWTQPPFCTDDQQFPWSHWIRETKSEMAFKQWRVYFCISTRFTHRDRFSSKPNCRWRMRRKTLKAQTSETLLSFIYYVSFHQHLHEVKL